MVAPSATCELLIDGQRVSDTDIDLGNGFTTALDSLRIDWGRDSFVDQPGPATCTFRLLDPDGVNAGEADQGFLDVVRVGSDVRVWAAGTIPTDPGQPPGLIETYDDPDLINVPLGDVVANRVGTVINSTAAVITDSDRSKIIALTPTDPGAAASVTVPPRRFSAPGTAPEAWDSIPRYQLLQGWRYGTTVQAPPGVQWRAVMRAHSTPYAATATDQISFGPTYTGTGEFDPHLNNAFAASSGADRWVSLQVEFSDLAAASWQRQTGAWADNPYSWRQYGVYAIHQLSLSAPGNVEERRRVLVFAGSVTDIVAAISGDSLVLEVTAADQLADLANRVIGDDPWLAQTVSARVRRIATLAGLARQPSIETPLGDVRLSWRDVDAQPVAQLLGDIAQSAGGVLWCATHATLGPYLLIENPANRAAVDRFTISDGAVAIVGRGAGEGLSYLSACDVVRDPVTWSQSISDVITTVTVQWQDQTVDDQGLPSPTERYTTVADDAGVDLYGRFRLSVATELISELDATTLANRVLAFSSAVGWQIANLALDTAVMPDEIDSVSDRARASTLLDLLDGTARMGAAVMLTDIPNVSPRWPTTGVYVDGGTYEFRGGAWLLQLLVTPTAGLSKAAAWNAFTAEYTWQAFGPITWLQTRGVSAPS